MIPVLSALLLHQLSLRRHVGVRRSATVKSIIIKRPWVEPSDLKEIPRIDARGLRGSDLQRFQEPVIFTGLTDDWQARKWSRKYLHDNYADVEIPRTILEPELFSQDNITPWEGNSLYADHLRNSYVTPVRPLVGMNMANFTKDEFHDDYFFAIDGGPATELSKDVDIPELFRPDDLVELTFGMGPTNEGVMFHTHMGAWNALMYGEKTWFFYHPEEFKGGQYEHLAFASSNMLNDRIFGSGANWPSGATLPTVAFQKPGEIVYIPAAWWHATVSSSDTACVGGQHHRDRLPTNFWPDLHKQYPQSGIATHAVAMSEMDPDRAMRLWEKVVALEPLHTIYNIEFMHFLANNSKLEELSRAAATFAGRMEDLRSQRLLTAPEQAAILAEMGEIIFLATEDSDALMTLMGAMEATQYAEDALQLDPDCPKSHELKEGLYLRAMMNQRSMSLEDQQQVSEIASRLKDLEDQTEDGEAQLEEPKGSIDWLSEMKPESELNLGNQDTSLENNGAVERDLMARLAVPAMGPSDEISNANLDYDSDLQGQATSFETDEAAEQNISSDFIEPAMGSSDGITNEEVVSEFDVLPNPLPVTDSDEAVEQYLRNQRKLAQLQEEMPNTNPDPDADKKRDAAVDKILEKIFKMKPDDTDQESVNELQSLLTSSESDEVVEQKLLTQLVESANESSDGIPNTNPEVDVDMQNQFTSPETDGAAKQNMSSQHVESSMGSSDEMASTNPEYDSDLQQQVTSGETDEAAEQNMSSQYIKSSLELSNGITNEDVASDGNLQKNESVGDELKSEKLSSFSYLDNGLSSADELLEESGRDGSVHDGHSSLHDDEFPELPVEEGGSGSEHSPAGAPSEESSDLQDQVISSESDEAVELRMLSEFIELTEESSDGLTNEDAVSDVDVQNSPILTDSEGDTLKSEKLSSFSYLDSELSSAGELLEESGRDGSVHDGHSSQHDDEFPELPVEVGDSASEHSPAGEIPEQSASVSVQHDDEFPELPVEVGDSHSEYSPAGELSKQSGRDSVQHGHSSHHDDEFPELPAEVGESESEHTPAGEFQEQSASASAQHDDEFPELPVEVGDSDSEHSPAGELSKQSARDSVQHDDEFPELPVEVGDSDSEHSPADELSKQSGRHSVQHDHSSQHDDEFPELPAELGESESEHSPAGEFPEQSASASAQHDDEFPEHHVEVGDSDSEHSPAGELSKQSGRDSVQHGHSSQHDDEFPELPAEVRETDSEYSLAGELSKQSARDSVQHDDEFPEHHVKVEGSDSEHKPAGAPSEEGELVESSMDSSDEMPKKNLDYDSDLQDEVTSSETEEAAEQNMSSQFIEPAVESSEGLTNEDAVSDVDVQDSLTLIDSEEAVDQNISSKLVEPSMGSSHEMPNTNPDYDSDLHDQVTTSEIDDAGEQSMSSQFVEIAIESSDRIDATDVVFDVDVQNSVTLTDSDEAVEQNISTQLDKSSMESADGLHNTNPDYDSNVPSQLTVPADSVGTHEQVSRKSSSTRERETSFVNMSTSASEIGVIDKLAKLQKLLKAQLALNDRIKQELQDSRSKSKSNDAFTELAHQSGKSGGFDGETLKSEKAGEASEKSALDDSSDLPDTVEVGDIVHIVNLASDSGKKFNGCYAKVISWDENTGRFNVKVHSTYTSVQSKVLALKPENLEKSAIDDDMLLRFQPEEVRASTQDDHSSRNDYESMDLSDSVAVGDVVKITDLASDRGKRFNGYYAKVVSWNKNTKRFNVKVSNNILALKTQNLIKEMNAAEMSASEEEALLRLEPERVRDLPWQERVEQSVALDKNMGQ